MQVLRFTLRQCCYAGVAFATADDIAWVIRRMQLLQEARSFYSLSPELSRTVKHSSLARIAICSFDEAAVGPSAKDAIHSACMCRYKTSFYIDSTVPLGGCSQGATTSRSLAAVRDLQVAGTSTSMSSSLSYQTTLSCTCSGAATGPSFSACRCSETARSSSSNA
jgi:hypothetical protein